MPVCVCVCVCVIRERAANNERTNAIQNGCDQSGKRAFQLSLTGGVLLLWPKKITN